MLAQAIKDERYADCTPLKNQINRLKEWEVQRKVCDRKKHAAVEDEDYEAAAKYAKEVKRLSQLIADAATLASITGAADDQKRKAAELAEKKRLEQQRREAEEKEKMKRQAAGDVLKPAPVPNLPTCRITML